MYNIIIIKNRQNNHSIYLTQNTHCLLLPCVNLLLLLMKLTESDIIYEFLLYITNCWEILVTILRFSHKQLQLVFFLTL